MGLFSKKEDKKEETMTHSLPKLPEFPSFNENRFMVPEPIHKLPNFPSGSIGDEFSQKMIKQAVGDSNKKYVIEDDEDSQELEERNDTSEFEHPLKHPKQEPIFIRIDKFEEAMKIFQKTKKKFREIESMLNEIQKLKEQEEKELKVWEKEIISAKEQIEKIDQEIFSKI